MNGKICWWNDVNMMLIVSMKMNGCLNDTCYNFIALIRMNIEIFIVYSCGYYAFLFDGKDTFIGVLRQQMSGKQQRG